MAIDKALLTALQLYSTLPKRKGNRLCGRGAWSYWHFRW
jgi:hypothetical protein